MFKEIAKEANKYSEEDQTYEIPSATFSVVK